MNFDSLPVTLVKPLSSAHIESAATDFLQIVAPTCLQQLCPTPVQEIFENKMDLFDFNVVIGKNVKGLAGLTDVTRRFIELSNATYKRLERNDPQARFTAAHEMGHAFLHANETALGTFPFRHSLTTAPRSKLRPYEDPEWQANSFAAAVLMPLQSMRLLHDQGKMHFLHVMKIFQVSWPAANRRILKLQQLRWRKPR